VASKAPYADYVSDLQTLLVARMPAQKSMQLFLMFFLAPLLVAGHVVAPGCQWRWALTTGKQDD
jgi:hypothetical protein